MQCGESALLCNGKGLGWKHPREIHSGRVDPALLKLKRVEIQGFKSFYDRTEMKFNGNGIAAVVGPNGCGKSNLSDAISWVLGEQSAKSLRGARMEDVIFAGTRDKKALGMASVTMTLVPDETALSAASMCRSNGRNVRTAGAPSATTGTLKRKCTAPGMPMGTPPRHPIKATCRRRPNSAARSPSPGVSIARAKANT